MYELLDKEKADEFYLEHKDNNHLYYNFREYYFFSRKELIPIYSDDSVEFVGSYRNPMELMYLVTPFRFVQGTARFTRGTRSGFNQLNEEYEDYIGGLK